MNTAFLLEWIKDSIDNNPYPLLKSVQVANNCLVVMTITPLGEPKVYMLEANLIGKGNHTT